VTTLSQRAEAEAVQPEASDLEPTRAEARGRAESVPTALLAVHHASPADARRDYVLSRLRGLLDRLRVISAKAAARAVFICQLATRPPSPKDLRDLHKEAASQWEAALFRWPRHLWGAGHTALYTAAYGALAVLFSPAGAVLAVAFIITCWFWS
jgi:hypothetical protein